MSVNHESKSQSFIFELWNLCEVFVQTAKSKNIWRICVFPIWLHGLGISLNDPPASNLFYTEEKDICNI